MKNPRLRDRRLLIGGLLLLALGLALTAPALWGRPGITSWVYYGERSDSDAGCPPNTICADWYLTATGTWEMACCVAQALAPGQRIYTNDPTPHCVRAIPRQGESEQEKSGPGQ